jgi:hypothetical protein
MGDEVRLTVDALADRGNVERTVRLGERLKDTEPGGIAERPKDRRASVVYLVSRLE